jgi:hypothetical protein
MFASIFILAFSVAALLYWAWYACRSILRGPRTAEEIERIAQANRLEFERVRRLLESGADLVSYDGLRDSLRHDFLALTYLLRYAATVHVGRYSNEERLLIGDFHLMRAVYRLSRAFSPRAARYALLEMAAILEYFATVMNRRMASFSAKMMEV